MSAQQLRITLAGRERVAEAGTTAEGLFPPNGTGGVAALAELDDLVGRAFLGARGRRRPAHERTL